MKKQLSAEGNYTEEELEEYVQSHKKLMIDSLWKLNVADIEATLSRVCQQVVLIHVCVFISSPFYLSVDQKLLLSQYLLLVMIINCFRFFKTTMSRRRSSVQERRD